MVLERSYWVAVGISSYIGLAGLQNSGLTPLGVATLLLGPALLWEVWRQTHRRGERAQLLPEQVWAARVMAAAGVGWAQARLAPGQTLLLEVAAGLCLATLAVASLYGLARIPRSPGLIDAPKNASSLDAAGFVACLWATVLVLAVARFIDTQNQWALDPLTLDYTNTAASVGTLLVFSAASWRVAVTRKLELGVADRGTGGLVLSLACLGVAVPATLVNIGPPDRVLPTAVVVAAASLIWTSLTQDPSIIARVLRATLAVLFLTSPLALILGGLAENHPEQAPMLVLLTALGATFVGLVAQRVARPLGPAQSRWLVAIDRAAQEVLVPEPTTAIVATLAALKRAFASPKATPELWRVDPPATLSVDVAGYLSERPAKVPTKIYDLALHEPEHTLRKETLAALQVKRSDLRGLLDWFDVRGAFSATAIVDGEDAIGFLLMPEGTRQASLTLEEAKALNALAERLSGVLSVTASLSRSRQQELLATQNAERSRAETARLRAVLDGASTRHQIFARHLARPMLSTAYSLPARNALSALEQWPPQPQPQVLLCPVGVDPKPWAAVAHLSNRSGAGPFLLLDGGAVTHGAGVDWTSSSNSALAMARGGTLFIEDADLLSAEHQAALVADLTAQGGAQTSDATGGEPDLQPCRVLLSFRHRGNTATPISVIPALNALLPNPGVRLPTLAERPDDLRALVLDTLGRSVRGAENQALGVDRQALQALLDFDWPGNDAQLRDVLNRAARLISGSQLTASSLRAVGFDTTTTNPAYSAALSPAAAPQSADEGVPPRRRRARVYRGRPPGS